jgi:hypothetical protein
MLWLYQSIAAVGLAQQGVEVGTQICWVLAPACKLHFNVDLGLYKLMQVEGCGKLTYLGTGTSMVPSYEQLLYLRQGGS